MTTKRTYSMTNVIILKSIFLWLSVGSFYPSIHGWIYNGLDYIVYQQYSIDFNCIKLDLKL